MKEVKPLETQVTQHFEATKYPRTSAHANPKETVVTVSNLELELMDLELLRVGAIYMGIASVHPLTDVQKHTYMKILQGVCQLSAYTPEERKVMFDLLDILAYHTKSLEIIRRMIQDTLEEK